MQQNSNLEKFSSVRRREVLISLILVLITVVVYWQINHFDFINYDDDDYITQNENVQDGITLDSIIWAFTTVHASNWHPLTWLSHMTDCQFFGLNPGRHHLTNLFFHITNTLLLFFVFGKMTGCLWRSAFIAALFALHPLHVESVAWVSERKDVLSGFFLLITTWYYVRYVRQPGFKRYVFLVFFFALGLMSKPMLVTLPFVFLLLDYWPLNRSFFQQPDNDHNTFFPNPKYFYLIWEKIPLVVLSAISCGVTFYAQAHGGSVKSLDFIPLKARLANAIVSYASYIEKMLYPSNLAVFYPYNGMIPLWKVISSLLLIVSISLFAIFVKHKRPYFIVGWLWFLGTLIPVIGLVQVGIQSMADRYTYIPFIGLFIIISWGTPELAEKLRHKKIWLAASATLTLTIFMAVTWKQIGYWKNSITLFEHAIEVTNKNYIAHYNLGVALAGSGHIDEAINNYYKSIKINSAQPDVHVNLGIALETRKHYREALFHFQKAASLNPKNYQAQYNLGTAYLKIDDLDQAVLHLKKALVIKPGSDQAQYNLGNAFFRKKQYESALFHLKKAIELNPGHYKARQVLGRILLEQGMIKDAEKQFKHLLILNPKSARIYNDLGIIALKQKRIHNASNYFKTALKYDPINEEARKNLEQLNAKLKATEKNVTKALGVSPNNPLLHYQLGEIYQAQDIIDKAIKQYEKVISLKPQSVNSLYNLAILTAKQGKYKTAISYLQAIISYQPDNPIHYYNIACMYAKLNRTKNALEWLEKSLALGYDNWDQIRSDEDLERIRATSEFKQLLKKHQ